MKVLLADDERMVRLGLISMLDELYPGEHTYIQAKNGKEMIKLMESHLPDIAFVDIKMPLMDGLEALEKCRKIHLNTQYLILSGYSDFEYARSAMHLGIQEYLLKPVSLETLQHVMETAQENFYRSIRQSNARFAHDISTAYNTTRSIGSGYVTAATLQYDNLAIYVFYIDHRYQETRDQTCRTLVHRIRTEMDKCLSSRFRYTMFFLETGEPCLITCGEKSNVNSFLSSLLLSLEKSVTCLYSENTTLNKLYLQCLEIKQNSLVRIIYGYGGLLCTDAELLRKSACNTSFLNGLEKLCRAYLNAEEIEYKNILNHLYIDQNCHRIFEEVNRASIAAYFHLTLGLTVNVENYKEFIRSLIDGAQFMYQNSIAKTEIDEINWVKEYIKENYMKEIGINTIAQILHISPNYLSKIFHERVGCKFIDYLTEVRITNAKRHFAFNPQITVKEVAGMVGYTSIRHFTKTFVRFTRCLPSEYIEKSRKEYSSKCK